MPEMGAPFSRQAMAAPGELLNLSLNATAVLPEGAVLLAMIATLLADLAGEKLQRGGFRNLFGAEERWSARPQWNAPEPSFLGAFLADNLAIARAVIALSTLLSPLISWRYAEQSERRSVNTPRSFLPPPSGPCSSAARQIW